MDGYYYLDVKPVSRGKGRAAVACAAYIAGENLRDDKYNKTHWYRWRHQDILEKGIELPDGAPGWMANRKLLWNRVEANEKRKDSRLARDFKLAFEHHFDANQRLELMHEFIQSEITSLGFVADWAIHRPNPEGDERNFHAHILVPDRAVAPTGFSRLKDPRRNTKQQLEEWRKVWEDIENRAFERYQMRGEDGLILRVDRRSYADRGIDQEPTVHLGVRATAMERKGIATELGDINRGIQRANQLRRERAEARQRSVREIGDAAPSTDRSEQTHQKTRRRTERSKDRDFDR